MNSDVASENDDSLLAVARLNAVWVAMNASPLNQKGQLWHWNCDGSKGCVGRDVGSSAKDTLFAVRGRGLANAFDLAGSVDFQVVLHVEITLYACGS
ncbi:hypothetical protein A0J61_11632 [Choanephora cucurbitarum]|uniref:Uncharacterized protein n=1 Tax=Choanephora cucurbitarum TaxID=101091 RepID=A0A1C7MV32_9FUNG|nr:hypothetical protein A0J61_11632 [Choanephora cucurbitarum]